MLKSGNLQSGNDEANTSSRLKQVYYRIGGYYNGWGPEKQSVSVDFVTIHSGMKG
jgi:hypothetical protein